MEDQLQRLSVVLADFDSRAGMVEYHDLAAAVDQLATEVRQSSAAPAPALVAESFAMSVCQCKSGRPSHWGVCYGPMFVHNGFESPGFSLLTPEIVGYWSDRASSTCHPYLRARYADLAWEFAPHVSGATRTPDSARLMIDAVLDSLASDLVPRMGDARRWMARALSVALQLRDSPRVERIRDAIIDRERRVPLDAPGIWGYSFDLLIDGSRHIPLSEDERDEIIRRLETRLEAIAALENTRQAAFGVESVVRRLATYYRRTKRPDDMQRVLRRLRDAYLQAVRDAEPLVAAHMLQQLGELLRTFGESDMADSLQPLLREQSREAVANLHTISAETELPTSEVEEYLAERTQGSYKEMFTRLAHEFVHRRGQMEQSLSDQLKQSTVANLFSTTLLDHEGRATATIGPADRDTEGQLYHHTVRHMQFGATFMRMLVERLKSARQLTADNVTSYLFQSELFAPVQHGLMAAGVRSYLADDWITSIHIFVPQIETAVRQLAECLDRPTLRPNRHGGNDLRMLGDLLGDEQVSQTLTADVAFHLRVLLADHRGMNVRNDVAHGLWPTSRFNSVVADLLFHVLLLLGNLRAPPADAQPADVS